MAECAPVAHIAIVGVGAIGAIVAGALEQSHEHQLLLCSRRGFERLVLEGPEGRTELDVRPLTQPAHAHRVDIVFLATKAHQTAGAGAWLSRLCDSNTEVVVLQNGVEHRERVAPLVGAATIIPCIVDCPSTTVQPGHVQFRRALAARFDDTLEGHRMATLLAAAGLTATVTDDFLTAAWTKLCLNVVSGPIPALCDQPHGVFRYEPITELARAIVRECVEVGRAEGARLQLDLVDEVIAAQRSTPPNWVTSMLHDRRAGRILETDSRNGAVVRAGRRHGIGTPANAFVRAVLSAVNAPGLDQ
ncbi:MAG: 2-dehydropantoate 2-reductase [Polyangiaceae bacterium]|nr:2-dehydropantoate 2-reductase [Polyangiaceae bacterium]